MATELKKEPRGFKAWFFTWNNPPDQADPGSALKILAETTQAIGYCFQLEEGDSGTPHYQGGMKWQNQMRMSTIVKHCPGIHLEKLRDAGTDYGAKEEGRLAGPWIENWGRPRKPTDVLSRPETVWRKWQLDLKAKLDKEPDDRTVVWNWETKGNVGKTAFAKHYTCMKPLQSLYVMGSAHHIKAAIALWIKNDTGDLLNVFYDVPRGEAVDYTALEQIKNGVFFSAKYESGMVVFPPVHLVCFANYAPAEDQLSADRWDITEI